MVWFVLCACTIWLTTLISLLCVVVSVFIFLLLLHNSGTVFAYGQTNSGKTHTMRGSPTEPGIIPLAVNNLFDVIHQVFLQFSHCHRRPRPGYTKSVLHLLFLLLCWCLHLKMY